MNQVPINRHLHTLSIKCVDLFTKLHYCTQLISSIRVTQLTILRKTFVWLMHMASFQLLVAWKSDVAENGELFGKSLGDGRFKN